MPHWALGRVMDLAVDLAGITRSVHPQVRPRTIVTMAGDHGVVDEGVSSFPKEVTVQMVHNFVNHGAAINALSKQSGTDVKVVDMGIAGDVSELAESGSIIDCKVQKGTANMLAGPAMTREDAVKSLVSGIDIAKRLSEDYYVLGTGDMGIGNTTPSTAIAAVLTGAPISELTGRGTGIEEEQLKHKINVIDKALVRHQPDANDAIDVLSKVGGFEIGGIAGLIIGAAAMRRPVVVDGFISTAGALLAKVLCPACGNYMIMSHCSAEPGHQAMHKFLEKEPLMDLNLRLGEGTGGAIAMNILDAAVAVLTEVATFQEAIVSGKNT